uniref:C-type lectin domain-containing protein n=1 Tax=Acrobeloides nanus TaxID=290746 RepID=A0A914D4M3_9BILA
MIPYLGVLLTFYFHLTNGFQCAPPLIEGFSPKYCYQIVKEQQVSWFAADYGCRQLGGSLATIDSAVLNALLVGAADEVFPQGTTFWIGYTNVYYPPQWLWNDGQNSSYNNWAP